jgi:hypothetical protein
VFSSSFLFLFASVNSISLYSGPRPEETVTYKDWVTGCDNIRNCEAVVLEVGPSGTDGRTDHLEIMIEQPLARHLGPSVSLKFPFSVASQRDLRLFVDQNEVKIPAPVDRRRKHGFGAGPIGCLWQGKEIQADFLLDGGKPLTIGIAPVQPDGLQIFCNREQYGPAHHRKWCLPVHRFQPVDRKEQIVG